MFSAADFVFNDATITMMIVGAGGMTALFILITLVYYYISKSKSHKIKLAALEEKNALLEHELIVPMNLFSKISQSAYTWTPQREAYDALEQSWNASQSFLGSKIITGKIAECANNGDVSRIYPKRSSMQANFGTCMGKRVNLASFPIVDGSLQVEEINENDTDYNQVEDEEKALKKVKLVLSEQTEFEWLKELRGMVHVNIAKLLHVGVSGPNLTVGYEYCGNGILEDILARRRPPLNFNARILLAKGLVAGLKYIHDSPVESHGCLNCRNCLIDDNFNIKISGFGFGSLARAVAPPHPPGSKPPIEKLFVAPELLPTYPSLGSGTRQGDVYSVAMLMYMIFFQKVPFEDIVDWNQLLGAIAEDKNGHTRPSFSPGIPEKYTELIATSWQFSPQTRPTVEQIDNRLKSLEPKEISQTLKESEGRNATSEYFRRDLDRYINDLEQSVISTVSNNCKAEEDSRLKLEKSRSEFKKKESEYSKQTKALEEKVSTLDSKQNQANDKCKALQSELDQFKAITHQIESENIELQKELSGVRTSFLPRPLAQLANDTIRSPLSAKLPEPSPIAQYEVGGNYQGVTVMVVTIVHFNKLVAKLEQTNLMLSLLRAYHEAIDEARESFTKIHIIEWISDTVIFASGAPDDNYRHAEDTAGFALKLQSWSQGPSVEAILGQEGRVQLRIGIHSGPITAGVVGKILKFVLMGETVNLAAKIESEAEKDQIRVSSVTMEILSNSGGYTFEAVKPDPTRPRKIGDKPVYVLVNGPLF